MPIIDRTSPAAAANSLEGPDLTPWDLEPWNIKDCTQKWAQGLRIWIQPDLNSILHTC